MTRIIIKGGIWKNTEDEVLKAAIAKYGKNQWARISSLLVRKTPKQCKARWYEWLDPSIKKTEWSKTEDEKLLHLAKLMPTQWRTIAPIVGRTATQCLERYQKLLDEAEAKENEELGLAGPDGDHGPSADDIRRLRPGEIDPDPETKPALPDPIDMDEDEKEMLSEARARLANTQGKKAKRKARERQLEEARRLAVLQKKRELKAAGIIMRHKTKKKGMDYNADIPFEKKPAVGFYDVADENAKAAATPVGQTLRRLENKRKPEEEDAERKKRQRKNNEGKGPASDAHQTKFIAARDAQIQKLKEAEQIGKRQPLVLPAAQVGETELEDIVKISQAGRSAHALVGDGSDASGTLLSDYDNLGQAWAARTPRTAPQQDNIMAEARNLLSMTQVQTPLLGDENTPLHLPEGGGTGFESATPRHQVAFTPNPLATPRSRGGDGSASSVSGTPLRTPMRDNLSLNPDGMPSYGDTPREQRRRAMATKNILQEGFSSLPKPANDFTVLVPDAEEEESSEEPITEEDAAERDARIQRRREEEERKALARRSLPVQQNLPRPANVDMGRLMADLVAPPPADASDLDLAQRLVDIELVQLLQHDSIVHPVPGTNRVGSHNQSNYQHPDDDDIVAARAAVHAELAQELGYPKANEEQVKKGVIALANDQDVDPLLGWAGLRASWTYDDASKSWRDPTTMNLETRINGISALLELDRDTMSKEAAKATKGEKKLAVTLGGYQARSKVLSKRLTDAFEEMQKTKVDYETFARLHIGECAAGPRRVSALKEEVEGLERREKNLQMQYQELSETRTGLQVTVGELEEKVMAEAESLNEAALAQMEE